MDLSVWAIAAAAALVLIPALLYFAPARTKIVIDTATSTARADLGLLFGLGPVVVKRALPKDAAGNPLAVFNDAQRIGYALMTPGIADAAFVAVHRLFALKPRVAHLKLDVNLGDNAQNVVVQTAAQAAFAAMPASVRERFVIGRCEAPGAELSAMFELNASPAQLSAIYGGFKNSRAANEFRRRVARKIKPGKKKPGEVRVS